MHLVHTGLNEDATDGELKGFVHATILTVSDAAGAVPGRLQKCGLFAEDGGRVRPNQCQSAGDKIEQTSGSVASFPKSVRFTLPQRSDGRPLVEFTTEKPSPVKQKLLFAIASDDETERELEPAFTKIKRAYNRKAKANIIKRKAAADGTLECAKDAKKTISNIKGKLIKQSAERVSTDNSSTGGESSGIDK